MEGSPGLSVDGDQSAETEYWAYALLDTSRMSTFCIAILLIVYGSFRSLNMERDAMRYKDKTQGEATSSVRTLDSTQALLLPVGASVSLLIMFFFFDSLQTIFALCTAVVATVAFAFLLLPLCQYLLDPCNDANGVAKISLPLVGRYTYAECASLCMSLLLVALWVCTGHWVLMDALGMGLCVAFMALVRLPSLKVSTVLLAGLLLYDVFWVFFSSYIFNANVMVRVATRPADNPMGVVARKLHLVGLGGMLRDPPKLSLPGKLVFPSSHAPARFTMLGLGDIVMPGLLLCFVLRYDAHKRAQALGATTAVNCELGVNSVPGAEPDPKLAQGGLSQSNSAANLLVLRRVTYFHCSLIGYFLGLVTATVVAEVFKAAQPALLYLVPFTLLPLLLMAYLKGDLARMWHEPFIYVQQAKFQTI